jgi:mono/diheme cytochrome c family protein
MRPILRISGRLWLAGLLTLASALAAACDRAPSADGLKEWTPTDHDGEKKTAKQGPKLSSGDGGGAAGLADLTWRSQCQSCHGAEGRGDGPQGAMFKAADLGREEWQSKVKDEEIAATITTGKGRMPKFDLPDEVVKGLVVRVRSFRGQ